MSNDQSVRTIYYIHVAGRLDAHWSAWFDGWQISHPADDETIIAGPVRDQAELHGLINRVFGLNLTLLAVYRRPDPNIEPKP